MSLKCGIVGLPNVGKSTLFNALTKAGIAAENYPFCTIEPNVGIVEVPDPRMAQLAEIVQPERIVPAVVEFVDIAGLVAGASTGEGLGNKFLAHIRETDATINVEEYATPAARVQRVRELTSGRGANIVMELVGKAELLAEGIDMLSNGGSFVEIGDIVRGREVSIDPSKLLAGKSILGSLMYRPALLPKLLDYLVRNRYKLPFHTIISHKFPLAEVNAAFEKAEWNQRQTEITRAVLVP